MTQTKSKNSSEYTKPDLERVIYKAGDKNPGPTMIVFGSVHGNEAAGAAALERVGAKLASSGVDPMGRIYFMRGNVSALSRGVRFIDADLNRHFTDTNIVRNLPGSSLSPQLSEDVEQANILTLLKAITDTASGEVYAIDLHSTSAEGAPFATVGDTMRNRAFAQMLPATILLGIEEQLEGTLLEYLNDQGVVTFGFEGGQHFAPSTVDVHEAMVWLALIAARIIPRSAVENAKELAQTVREATGPQRIVEVRYRHAITDTDDFQMRPGFESFDPIRKGTHLADDRSGEIRAKESGMVIMPLYQKLGEDGFFIGREVNRFWIRLSGVLRRFNVGDFVHWLPGVKRDGNSSDKLLVNTTVARIFPLQLFHLLGFRKLRWHDNTLVVSRRKYDLKGPFE